MAPGSRAGWGSGGSGRGSGRSSVRLLTPGSTSVPSLLIGSRPTAVSQSSWPRAPCTGRRVEGHFRVGRGGCWRRTRRSIRRSARSSRCRTPTLQIRCVLTAQPACPTADDGGSVDHHFDHHSGPSGVIRLRPRTCRQAGELRKCTLANCDETPADDWGIGVLADGVSRSGGPPIRGLSDLPAAASRDRTTNGIGAPPGWRATRRGQLSARREISWRAHRPSERDAGRRCAWWCGVGRRCHGWTGRGR